MLREHEKSTPPTRDLQAFPEFSQHPAWVYYAGKLIETAVCFVYKTIVSSSKFTGTITHGFLTNEGARGVQVVFSKQVALIRFHCNQNHNNRKRLIILKSLIHINEFFMYIQTYALHVGFVMLLMHAACVIFRAH